jgi:hypothetical protein
MIDTSQFDGHTPGPWMVYKPCMTSYKIGVDAQDGTAVVWSSAHDDEGIRNPNDAKLIAAAPDLLAEVKRQAEVIGELAEVLKTVNVKKDTHEWCRYSHNSDRWPCHSCGVEIAEYRESDIPPSLWEPSKVAKAVLDALAKLEGDK